MVDSTESLSNTHGKATTVDYIEAAYGREVKRVREAKGMSPQDLADRLNEVAFDTHVTADHVLRLERGGGMNDNAKMYIPEALGLEPLVFLASVYGALPMPEAPPEAPLNQDAVDQLTRILQLLPPKERYRHFRAADKKADQELTVPGRDHDGIVS